MKTVWNYIVIMCTLAVASIGANILQECGTELADVLELACQGQYYRVIQTQKKRNGLKSSLENLVLVKRNVAEECCENPCRYEQLAEYCLYPTEARRRLTEMISRRNENNTPDPIRHIASSSRVIIQRPSSAAAHRSYVRFTELGRIDNAIRIPTRNNPTRAP